MNSKNDIILIENDDSPVNCLADEQPTNQENKENCMQKTYYWIGKETLKLWPNLALKKYELQLPTSKSNDLDDEVEEVIELPDVKLNEASMPPEESKKCLPVATADPQENSIELTYFNEDIICPHKNLSTTVNKRLVTSNTWKLFEHYFYSDSMDFQSKIFTNESKICKICQVRILETILSIFINLIFFNIKKSNEEAANKTLEIKNQKELLNDLYFNRQRPNLLTDLKVDTVYYLISTEFLKNWRSLIKLSKYKDIQINNSLFLCPHSMLPFDETSIDVR